MSGGGTYRLIFLDVDGVLNSSQGPQGGDQIQAENVQAFASIFKQLKPAPHIVVSSTWKYKAESLGVLQRALVEAGVFGPADTFLSHTPDLRDAGPGYPKENAHNTRTDEILVWLKFNTAASEKQRAREHAFPLPFAASPADWGPDLERRCVGPNTDGIGWRLVHPIELESFVVIDDINLLEHGCLRRCLESNFVRTDVDTGLTEPLAREAARLLQTRFNYAQWRKRWFTACPNPACLLKPKDASTKESKDSKDKDSTSQKFRRLLNL